jgi:hypothetical protein
VRNAVVALTVVASVAAFGGVAAADETSGQDTRLTVLHRDAPGAPAIRAELACNVAAAEGSWSARACAVLRASAENGEDPFAPVAPGQVCSVAYGGPEIALVQGRWYGRVVDAEFTRTNSCEVARWNRISPVLDPAPPAES